MTLDLIVVVGCGFIWLLHLIQLLRMRSRAALPAIAIACFGIALSVAGKLWQPQDAAAIAIGVLFLLLLAPALSLRGAGRALKWGQIGRARVLAFIAWALRPLAAQRLFRKSVEISWRLNRGDAVDIDAAVDNLGKLNAIERNAHALAYLSWTNDFSTMAQRLEDARARRFAMATGMAGTVVTVLGETADRDALLTAYDHLKSGKLFANRSVDGSWTLLVVAAHLGAVELVREHAAELRSDVPPERLAFLIATAQQRSGRHAQAESTLTQALAGKILNSGRARLEYRRQHPLQPLESSPRSQLALADVGERLRTRRALGALAIQWRRPSPLTWSIAVTIAAAYAWQRGQPQWPFFDRWGLIAPWAKAADPYRMLSYAWVHLDIAHFLINILGLLLFGRFVERNFGRLRMLVIYLLGATGGAVAFLVLESRPATAVGASGAIFALFGATLACVAADPALRRSRQGRRELIFLCSIAVMQLAVDALWEQSAGSAHAGGLVCGLVIGFLIRRKHATAQTLNPQ